MDNLLRVSNVQRVCFHDGPGIRTTIFFSGCSLKCPWCSNPETSIFINKHPKFSNEIEEVCKFYNIDELYNVIIQDRFLYGKEGGVTFSGGEPLLQSENLSVLMKRLKKDNVNITIETSLYVNKNDINNIINYTDLFIIDIKILNKKEAIEILNGNLDMYLKNLKLIFEKNKRVIFRIPLIYPYIANAENLNAIYDILNKYKPFKVEIFKGHNLGKEKYKKLGLEYTDVNTINDDEIKKIKNKISSLGIRTEIISF